MKRGVLVGSALFLIALGGVVGYKSLRRPAHLPQINDLDGPPFLVQPSGRGWLIAYHSGDIPIRALAWSHPLPGGAVVAQLLSQSGRQQAFLFLNGQLTSTLNLNCPSGMPATAFAFAELKDAALVPGRLLLLLYRTRMAAEPTLVIAWDLARGAQTWVYRGLGAHLALSPHRNAAFLFDDGGPVQRLPLVDGKPGLPAIDLPPDITGVSDLLPLGGSDFMVAWTGGVGSYQHQAWSEQLAPTPSPLGFAPGQGVLARTGEQIWWQPEPGRLLELSPDGSLPVEQDLTRLLSGPHAQDHALLRLLGADGKDRLWFAPEAPSFQASGPGLPPLSPPSPVPSPANPHPEIASAPPSSTHTIQDPPPTPAAWTPYLQAGLARLYCWAPGSNSMQIYDLKSIWPRLNAPEGLSCPDGDGGLVPAAGGLLLGNHQERRWWLPLDALPATQPR
jgi:hypothetical protein